ncbi:magnesium chelatase subunit D family protein [Luteipulveratus sp. YIM 133132]|uniref:Mg-protoporphyrin IX chelatase n=1 Tax=Luteipulveratus flavus TaxID=3031728 RepID=A0ABT6CAX6_9MICO|nr:MULTISPECIES: magnesium chelatase subunit D family protein [unclassified Luteipulveratus]MDE9365232.1 magnesium chelatase subunit D family protein [Luteipulveratus sp. YIM 133132]MDF8264431.1 magnesium chelatase subunit D family protein [Luteipulveratus sp. YIM 133296]
MHAALPTFPFSAVVGADDMSLALLITAVAPDVGGVLVRGEKGTAKSTTVRGLTALLPPVDVVAGCRFSCDPAAPDPRCPDGPHTAIGTSSRPARLVELPVGASEDRLLGSLHLHKALAEGVAEYDPGLLAAAHRGLLYVDEVNLLQDHLVDVLLDAAAMGRSTVERDGVSVSHASRFVLVGTMNPEEGELRPQLLDRFGLTVEVAAPRDPRTRVDVVRRRLAYDADPAGFVADWQERESDLARRVQQARAAVGSVELSDAALIKIAEVCAAFEVDGMRADIVTARAASAHAAWHGRDRVTIEDIRAAARLSIPHRRRRNPFDAPGLDEDLLDQILGEEEPPPPPPGGGEPEPESGPGNGPSGGDSGPNDGPTADPVGGEDAPGDGPSEAAPERAPERAPAQAPAGSGGSTLTGAGTPYRARLFSVSGTGAGEVGRRSPAESSRGRTAGARRTPGDGSSVHLVSTIHAAAGRRTPGAGRLRVTPTDLRYARRIGRESNLVLLCVDASGSMAARRRMEQVKTAVLSLLLDAYQRRDKVGLVTFRGDDAELLLPPTSSVDVAARRLQEMPAGGRTPLAEGLLRAAETLRLESLRDPRRRPLLIVVTDGRATAGADAVRRSQQAAAYLASSGIASVVIDCETGRFTMGLARDLAAHLGAEHVAVGEVAAEHLVAAAGRRAS